ncbi:unnamed protein product [Miscanthus lutarioriparius]|uniref:Uncharacterized protein n=1 Tax=Miscanthus lutarioriparius TaxID=422564 RepID=A0A811RFQ1_9POAL|nr:unnamed protein product [Miscanthus lutarioriparius]
MARDSSSAPPLLSLSLSPSLLVATAEAPRTLCAAQRRSPAWRHGAPSNADGRGRVRAPAPPRRVVVLDADINDAALLERHLSVVPFTHVLRLAAQAALLSASFFPTFVLRSFLRSGSWGGKWRRGGWCGKAGSDLMRRRNGTGGPHRVRASVAGVSQKEKPQGITTGPARSGRFPVRFLWRVTASARFVLGGVDGRESPPRLPRHKSFIARSGMGRWRGSTPVWRLERGLKQKVMAEVRREGICDLWLHASVIGGSQRIKGLSGGSCAEGDLQE